MTRLDPGRKAIELRESDYVATGDVVLTEHGVQWLVWNFDDTHFHVNRVVNGRLIFGTLKRGDYRVKVEK